MAQRFVGLVLYRHAHYEQYDRHGKLGLVCVHRPQAVFLKRSQAFFFNGPETFFFVGSQALFFVVDGRMAHAHTHADS